MGFDLIENQDFFPLPRINRNFIDEKKISDFKNFSASTNKFLGKFVEGAKQSGAIPSGNSKLLAGTQVASGIADLGLGIASTVASIKDAQKRAEIEERLQTLTLEKQQELEREVQNAQSLNERLKIITDAVTRIKIAEVQGKLSGKDKTDNNKKILYIVGGSFALLVGIVLIKLVSK